MQMFSRATSIGTSLPKRWTLPATLLYRCFAGNVEVEFCLGRPVRVPTQPNQLVFPFSTRSEAPRRAYAELLRIATTP